MTDKQYTLEDYGIFDESMKDEVVTNTELVELFKGYNVDITDIWEALSVYAATNTNKNELRRDNALLHLIVAKLIPLQYRKEGSYGDSWAKRGELEVFFNISRKFDRLENIMLNGSADEVGESYVDTVADLANYGLLWMTYILREKPELFNKWLDDLDK